MSVIDNLMSQVIDFNEKEKEETILFLATALDCGNPKIVRNISNKVNMAVMPFLVNVLLKGLAKKESEGGEKVGSTRIGKVSEKD